MKEPSLCRRRKPSSSTIIKLACSFNGGFQRPPPSGKPRYVGGETRILAVDRTIGFLSLRTKISELCPAKPVFALKYLLPESDDAFLVSIASDDDVRCMIEEFDRLKLYGNPSRLWIFACNGEDASFKRFEFEGFDANVGGFCRNTGVYGRKRVNGLDVKFCGNGKAYPRVWSVSKESKNMVTGVAGVQRHGDEELSPREMILKLQLLAKKSQQTQSSCSSDIIGNNTELKCENGSPKNEDASDDLASELQVSERHEVTREGLEDLFGANMSKFHKNMDTPHLQGSRTLGRLVQVLVPHSNYLNLRGGNLCVGSNCSAQNVSACLDQMFGNDAGVNSGQNIMPCSHNCDLLRNPVASFSYCSHLAGSTYPQRSMCMCDGVKDSLQLSICNHEFCVNDQKNQRNTSYNIQNHQIILTPIGNNQTIRLDRRPNLGKCYSGLGPNLKMSKTGLSMKSHHPDSLKEMYCAHNQKMEGKVVDSTRKGQEVSFFNIRCCKENLPEPVVGLPLPKFGKHQSPSSPCTYENSSCCLGAMETQGDLLANFQHDGHEDLCQPACKNLHGVPINCAIQKETSLINLQGADSIFCHANYSVSSNGTEVTSSGKLLDMRTSTKEEIIDHKALQCDKASSVDISFWDLSSLCEEEEEPLALSAASSAGSERLLKPQPQILDLIDEKGVCLGPKEEKSNGVTANYSSQTAVKNHIQIEGQQDSLSNISINKKAEAKGSPKYSEIIDKTPSELAAFYSYLVSRELQTIKYSDLEYIKELGTGTYGTVFYGKWRGSDVAIKRIKPSCFTGGAMEEDRLVADFWKEAHILGQLHHPNIVTLYGVVRDGPVKDFAAVTEYMVNGSLKQVLQRKDRIIDRRKRLIIAMDAAFGMEYLHEKNIVHFDLKSHNFLVNIKDPQRPVCKICDLGLSKVKQNALVSSGVRGTLPWMAPELLSSKTSMVTEKVDVYSFGIVMWELLAGEEPYGNMRSEEIMAGIIKGNLRPEVPSWCDPAWRSLMERCWSSDPESRPSFSEIAKELRAVSAAMNIR